MTGHDLRARTLISRGDPRIHHALRQIPHSQRPASPDAAYWQAALLVAQRDARTETTRRTNRGCYRAGYTTAALIMLACAAGIVWATTYLWW
ncbi:hypothetical protein [Nocardiopsis lucentensis]|uniref:hypothetical protein n=1 Tax=Nocardiopsis lucentensis TaxID=53441 RepID=UPI0003481CF3|nr:hypothetical protein [Nocardiopsis lucentensis]